MRESVYKVSCITSIRHQCLLARDRLVGGATAKPAALSDILARVMEGHGTDKITAAVLDDVCNALQAQTGRGPTDSEIFDAFLDDRVVRPLRAAYIARHTAVDAQT
jgi:hypothetical protein